jgi:hypothetical protein
MIVEQKMLLWKSSNYANHDRGQGIEPEKNSGANAPFRDCAVVEHFDPTFAQVWLAA